MEFGTFVAQRRKKLGASQNELANYLGYSDSAISKMEISASYPPITLIPALANHLFLSVDSLLNREINPPPLLNPNPDFNFDQVTHNLIALRLSHNLTQNQEGDVFHVTKRTIINYEKGLSYPTVDILDSLLAYYQISASAFFYSCIHPEIHSRAGSSRHSFPKHLAMVLLGVVIGCGVISSILVPQLVGSRSSSSTASVSAPFGGSFVSSSDSTSASDSASESTPSSAVSPYLDYVKDLRVITTNGNKNSVTMQATDTLTLTVYSESYDFNDSNKSRVTLNYYLDKYAPGVAKLALVDTHYPQVNLTVSGLASTSTFFVWVYACSVDHPSQADGFTGKPIEVTAIGSTSSFIGG